MPTLTDFQSTTMVHRTGDVFNPPGLTNFLGCLQAAPGLMAVQHLTFAPYSQGDIWIGTLTLNDCCLHTSSLPIHYTWRPDRIDRHMRVDGFDLHTQTVMGVRAQTVTIALRIKNTAPIQQTARLRIQTGDGVIHSLGGWKTPYSPKEGPAISVTPWEGTPPPESLVRNTRTVLPDGAGLLYTSQTSTAYSLQATVPPPDNIDRSWLHFAVDLAPGEKRTLYFFIGIGGDKDRLKAAFEAWRLDPEAAFATAEADWQAEVDAVFTPGNDRYSGHLPTLLTENSDLQAIYLNAIIGVVYFKREPPDGSYGRTYTTLMPRYWVTTSFINDWSLSAYLLAMLDPDCLRKHVELWLARDIYSHFGTEYVSGGNAGNWYSCNDFALTRLITAYLRVTGDFDWLDHVAGERSIRAHLLAMARHYRDLDGGSGLADYGDRNSLLEAVGSYTHEVASLNAANVWMLREVASLLDYLGDEDETPVLRQEAAALVPKVQTLYVSGSGYWACRQPDGTLVPVRHVWDFIHTINFLHDDLPPVQIDEMITFFQQELQSPAWMAALSPLDEDIGFSLRPDHQWNGSFPGWVAFAACAVARAGRWEVLAGWLPGLARSANQGPYSQAHFVETYAEPEDGGARKAPTEWPYINDWAIVCVGGFVELVLFQLFGLEMGYAELTARPHLSPFDPEARLENVPYQGHLFTAHADGWERQ